MTHINARYGSTRVWMKTAAMFAGVIYIAACVPLPIPHTAQVTPKIVGTLRRSDGSTAAGVAMSVSAKHADSSCTYPGVHTVTNPAGRFQLPAGKVRKRIFWLSWMETFGMTDYWLCVQPVGSSTSPRRAYVRGNVAGDVVDCLEWVWREKERLTCNGPLEHRIVDGGEWTDSTGLGIFRVIVADADARAYKFQGFVQWLDPIAFGEAVHVRAVVELPGGDNLSPWDGAALSTRNGRWYISVTSLRPRKNGNESRLMFEVGPPGQVRPVPTP
jgi:hypothetical protein